MKRQFCKPTATFVNETQVLFDRFFAKKAHQTRGKLKRRFFESQNATP